MRPLVAVIGELLEAWKNGDSISDLMQELEEAHKDLKVLVQALMKELSKLEKSTRDRGEEKESQEESWNKLLSLMSEKPEDFMFFG